MFVLKINNNNGFTLIEILVTITVLSIVLAVAVPKLDLNMGYLDKTSSEFVMDVRYVQIENMKKPGSNYEIKIYRDSRKYYVRNGMNIEKTVIFKDRYNINYNNGDVISFTCDGAPRKAGTFTITDTKTNEIKQITIVPATGRTIILE